MSEASWAEHITERARAYWTEARLAELSRDKTLLLAPIEAAPAFARLRDVTDDDIGVGKVQLGQGGTIRLQLAHRQEIKPGGAEAEVSQTGTRKEADRRHPHPSSHDVAHGEAPHRCNCP